MIEILEKSSGKVLGLRVNGKLVHEDYQKFVPMLEEMIQKHGSIRCYFEMAEFHGITPHALWDELKFDIKHCRDVERCAVVGEKTSHEWMTKLGGAKRTVGLATWEEKRFGAVTITAVPAHHIAITNGYIIQGKDACIYFAGDTYYGDFMAEMGRRFHIDVDPRKSA